MTRRILVPGGMVAALLFTVLVAGCDSDAAVDPVDATTGEVAPDTVSADSVPADTVPADTVSTDTAVPDVVPDVAPDVAPDGAADVAADVPPDAAPDAVVVPPGPAPICVQGDFAAYHGLVHAHSTISDGAGPPEQAFAHARDEAGLDIFVLSDHMEVLVGPTDELAECRAVADTFYEPGAYLTDCGFEYATSIVGLNGHNNVFFAPQIFRLVLAFESLYEDLAACDTCVAQFNHPGDEPTHTWFDYGYDAGADEKIALMEFNTPADPWEHFFRALDAGWHVSPTLNQDNHEADWGTRDDGRSGFWMTALTREALHDAMFQRRSFMTWDANATIRMTATLPGDVTCWMGSILDAESLGGAGDTLELRVEAADPDPDGGFDRIEWFGPETAPLGTFECGDANPCVATVSVSVAEPGYVVARAWQTDGDELVAAPIWFAP